MDKEPLMKKDVRVELGTNYFSIQNGCELPFTRGRIYRIKKVVRYSRPNEGKYVRTAVILVDDSGRERRVDNSFLAKPGYWEAHKDDPEEKPVSFPGHRPPPSKALEHPEHVPPEDSPGWSWDINQERYGSMSDDDSPTAVETPAVKVSPKFGPFSTAFKEYMEKLGISAEALVMRMGVTEEYIRQLGRRSNIPRIDTAHKVADAFRLEGEEREEFFISAGYDLGQSKEMSFSRLIRKYRMLANKSQKDVATKLSLAPSYVSALESGGKVVPSQAVIEGLAEYLSIEGKERHEFFRLAGYPEMWLLDFEIGDDSNKKE